MAYLGNSPTQQAFTPAIDYFSGTGSATAFTLSRPVASVAQVQVTIDNVAQNPSSAYTVSANTITFTSAPLSGTNNIYVYYTSPITQVIAPGQGTVNTTSLTSSLTLTTPTLSGDTTAGTINGLTVGKGGGSVSSNTAVGNLALAATATGGFNTGVGANALGGLTSGTANTALGQAALYANNTGTQNVGIGQVALFTNTSGGSNVAVGNGSLQSNTTASNNTAIGYQAGYTNTTSSQNTYVGSGAGYLTTGQNNVGIGYRPFFSGGGGSGGQNTAIGNYALYVNAAGASNTALGMQALFSNTSASNNTAVGYQALYANTTASSLTAVGYQALYSNTTGTENTAVGYLALDAVTTTTENTAVGAQALTNCTGNSNTAVGRMALRDSTSGASNTAVGLNSMLVHTTGSQNTSIGRDAGASLTTGSVNTCLGYAAGAAGSPFEITTQSNRVVVGENGVTNAYIRVAWTVTSDARDKTNIADIPHGLNFVQQLKPKQYQFNKSREDDTPQGNLRYGFLAQDILALEGDTPVVIDNEMPDHLKYQGESLVPILVKAIQELSAKNDALTARIEALENR